MAARDKKAYEKPRVLAVQDLEGKSAPCALAAGDSACAGGVYAS